MSAFEPIPLGRRIPDRLHAVSCSLPTMRDVVGFEEKDPGVLQRISSSYPRFVQNPCLRRLADHLARRHGLAGRTIWLTASARSAAALAAHLSGLPAGRGAQVQPLAYHGLHGVIHNGDPGLAAEAHSLLQNTGTFLSSREAEDALVRLGVLPAAEPELLFEGDASAEIKRVLRRAMPAAGDEDLLPACSGMNAVAAAIRAAGDLQAGRGRTAWVQLGWAYRDTIALFKRFTSGAPQDYLYLSDVNDLAALERLFSEHGRRIAGVFAETPTNPLIQTPNVPALAALARRWGAKLILDPSVVSPFCVDVLAHADLVVDSLTKYTAGEGDILAGLVVVNPAGPDAAELRRLAARHLEPVYSRDLSRLAAEIGECEHFLAQLNAATPRVAAWLESHPKVRRVYWAMAPDSRANYLGIARSPAAVGCMLSFSLKTPLAPFYDAVRLPKGPSFGMRSSLLSPFFYIAHYDLVKTGAGRAELAASGIDPELVRLSIGSEPAGEIIAALEEALGFAGGKT